MNSKGPIDSYLHELSRKLSTFPTRKRRILKEAREHLKDSATQETDRGGSNKDAESIAVALFGSTDDFIARIKAKGRLSLTPIASSSRSPSTQSSSNENPKIRTASTKIGSSHLARRYPALAFIAVGAALALLLPTALNIPQSGPTNLAEYAPVPGKGEGASQLSDLSQANSGGLGFGSGTGQSQGAGSESLGAPGQRRPKLKRCVGNPPRQTEDPLSPPCVAFFVGDNGGATAKGVTRDEIRFAIASLGCGQRGGGGVSEEIDPNGTDRRAPLLRFFNERFQTYGRRVRAWYVSPPCGEDRRSAAHQRAQVRWWDHKVDPFGAISWGSIAEVDEAAQLGIWTDLEGGSRAAMRNRAPYMWSFNPDLEGQVDHATEFVCQKLAGRPARYSGEAIDWQRRRVFAITYQRDADRELKGRDAIVERIREGCGDDAGPVRVASADNYRCCDDPWARAWANDLARWRAEGVTTIISMIGNWSVWVNPTFEATGWSPELAMVNDGNVTNLDGRLWGPKQMAHAFGIQFAPLVPEQPQDSYRYQAYREACPDGSCAMPSEVDYYQFLMIFRGIQAAGPRLTVANLDRGLHAIPPRPSPDPFTPAAYFAPGNYSFIKDATVVRWDPAGVPPGGQSGCWRYVQRGKRYRAEDWQNHPTDEDFDRPGWPCRGEG